MIDRVAIAEVVVWLELVMVIVVVLVCKEVEVALLVCVEVVVVTVVGVVADVMLLLVCVVTCAPVGTEDIEAILRSIIPMSMKILRLLFILNAVS